MNKLRKTFKFRCYPNKKTISCVKKIMKLLGDIWCNTLKDREEKNKDWNEFYSKEIEKFKQKHGKEPRAEERKKIAKKINEKHKKGITSYRQQYQLISKKEHQNDMFWQKKYGWLNAQMMQTVQQRLDDSYKSYYGLKKNGDIEARKPGRRKYFKCITYRHQSGWKMSGVNGNVLELAGIGRFRLRMHRPIEGKIKTISITEKNGKWYAGFSVEIEKKTGMCSPVPKPSSLKNKACGKSTIISGVEDPKIAGTYNVRLLQRLWRRGVEDPKIAGTYNSRKVSVVAKAGVKDPKRAGTYNKCFMLSTGEVGVEDPKTIEIAFGFKDNIFLYDSEGRAIEHPAFYQTCIGRLAELNRKLDSKEIYYICSKCGYKHKKVPTNKTCQGCGDYLDYTKQESNNWHKAKYTLEKFHEKIANRREHFLWPIARFYAVNYDKIIVPNWPMKKQIEYAVNNKTSIRLTDGAYTKFIEMLKHKCNEFGKTLIIGPENKDLKGRAKLLDLEKAKLKKVKRILKKANSKLRKEAI